MRHAPINQQFSYCMQLQLIDSIFINSLDYHTVSGNVLSVFN